MCSSWSSAPDSWRWSRVESTVAHHAARTSGTRPSHHATDRVVPLRRILGHHQQKLKMWSSSISGRNMPLTTVFRDNPRCVIVGYNNIGMPPCRLRTFVEYSAMFVERARKLACPWPISAMNLLRLLYPTRYVA